MSVLFPISSARTHSQPFSMPWEADPCRSHLLGSLVCWFPVMFHQLEALAGGNRLRGERSQGVLPQSLGGSRGIPPACGRSSWFQLWLWEHSFLCPTLRTVLVPHCYLRLSHLSLWPFWSIKSAVNAVPSDTPFGTRIQIQVQKSPKSLQHSVFVQMYFSYILLGNSLYFWLYIFSAQWLYQVGCKREL